MAISLIGIVLKVARRIASIWLGSQASMPRAARLSSVVTVSLTRVSASAMARRAEVPTSASPCRSINPLSQKLNATSGTPARTAPTMTAKTFRRVNARTNDLIPTPTRATHPGAGVVSHGAVKTTLSLRLGKPNQRASAAKRPAMVSNELTVAVPMAPY